MTTTPEPINERRPLGTITILIIGIILALTGLSLWAAQQPIIKISEFPNTNALGGTELVLIAVTNANPATNKNMSVQHFAKAIQQFFTNVALVQVSTNGLAGMDWVSNLVFNATNNLVGVGGTGTNSPQFTGAVQVHTLYTTNEVRPVITVNYSGPGNSNMVVQFQKSAAIFNCTLTAAGGTRIAFEGVNSNSGNCINLIQGNGGFKTVSFSNNVDKFPASGFTLSTNEGYRDVLTFIPGTNAANVGVILTPATGNPTLPTAGTFDSLIVTGKVTTIPISLSNSPPGLTNVIVDCSRGNRFRLSLTNDAFITFSNVNQNADIVLTYAEPTNSVFAIVINTARNVVSNAASLNIAYGTNTHGIIVGRPDYSGTNLWLDVSATNLQPNFNFGGVGISSDLTNGLVSAWIFNGAKQDLWGQNHFHFGPNSVAYSNGNYFANYPSNLHFPYLQDYYLQTTNTGGTITLAAGDNYTWATFIYFANTNVLLKGFLCLRARGDLGDSTDIQGYWAGDLDPPGVDNNFQAGIGNVVGATWTNSAPTLGFGYKTNPMVLYNIFDNDNNKFIAGVQLFTTSGFKEKWDTNTWTFNNNGTVTNLYLGVGWPPAFFGNQFMMDGGISAAFYWKRVLTRSNIVELINTNSSGVIRGKAWPWVTQ